MAFPISAREVEKALMPWVGTIFLVCHPEFSEEIAVKLKAYSPYKHSFEDLKKILETLLITQLNSLTFYSLTIYVNNQITRHITNEVIDEMTDDLMGVLFDKLTPLAANYLKLNDYSMHHCSLAAMRVLYQKYGSFFSEEEYSFLILMIKRIFPAYRWQTWL